MTTKTQTKGRTPQRKATRASRKSTHRNIAAKAPAKTKQAQLIELLRRPEGSTVPQVATALGWQRNVSMTLKHLVS